MTDTKIFCSQLPAVRSTAIIICGCATRQRAIISPIRDFEDLAAPTPNPETERISTYERGNASDYSQGVWKWDDSGTLTQVSSYQVATDEDGNVTISSTDESGNSSEFTVTSEEYTTVNELMSGTLVDYCISRYGGSEQRSFTFEGMADVTDVSCYSVLMTEGGLTGSQTVCR